MKRRSSPKVAAEHPLNESPKAKKPAISKPLKEIPDKSSTFLDEDLSKRFPIRDLEEELEFLATSVFDEVTEVELPLNQASYEENEVAHFKNAFFFLVDKIFNITDEIDPLNTELISEFRELYEKISEVEHSEVKGLFDQFMRDYMLVKVLKPGSPENCFLLMELSIKLAREGIVTPTSPITLLTDLVELSELPDCESLFEFVEKRLHTWKEPLFLNSGKNFVLRMCNDLIRRLSRSQNTIFCGRILIFLSNYFPFCERSGLNIMSEFNTENLTVYKIGDGSDDPDDKIETIEEKPEILFEGIDVSIPGIEKMVTKTQEEKKNKLKVDFNLYVKFWSLQDFFRNPIQCYNKIAWKTFTMYANDVLNAFTSFKIEARKPEEEEVEDKFYFPKNLTNRRLLELQLSDPSFRRYFLVQVLIVFQYLTLSVKFKSEAHQLNEEQLDYIKKTVDKIYELIGEIPPDASKFVKAVKHILKREELWNKWKNDGCPKFNKPTVSSTLTARDELDDVDKDKIKGKADDFDEVGFIKKKKRANLGDIIKEADSRGKILFGNSELTRLWNICPDNLEACRSKSRDFMPSIDIFFSEAFKEIEKDESSLMMAPDAYKKDVKPKKILGNSNWGWKALRVLARRSPYFFQMYANSPINPMQNYLEFVLKKIINENQSIKNDTQALIEKKDTKKEVQQQPQPEPETQEQEMEVEGESSEIEEQDEEEGEVATIEKIRTLTKEEQKLLGKLLGEHWKKLALKVGFESDEIEFFESDKKEEAAAYMLQMWTEQDEEEASTAQLIYFLEGLGLKAIVERMFPSLN